MSNRLIHFNEFRRMKVKPGGTWKVLSHAEAARLRSRPKAHTLPSSEYTRILLDAKEGIIKPGDADRKIARHGGQVAVKALPRPPEQ